MVTRTDIMIKIKEHLAGKLSSAALAAWAFDRFYAQEIGDEEFAEEEADVIAAVLDELMFADDASFALDEPALQTLITRLQAL